MDKCYAYGQARSSGRAQPVHKERVITTPQPRVGPWPPEHVKVTFSGIVGTLIAPAEVWVHGLSMSIAPTATGTVDLPTFATRCKNAWVAHVAPHVGFNALLTRVRAARVDGQGLVFRGADGAFNQADDNSGAPGGTQSPIGSGVFQIAHAVSTMTVTPGAVGRGRFYLPAPTKAPGANGQITEADAATVANAMKAFINAINLDAATLGLGSVVVASAGSVKSGRPPSLYPVTGVRVGRRLDILRSRANAVPELYVSRALVG